MSAPTSDAPRDANASSKLVSDAERDAAVDRLHHDYVDGRLTLDELGERTDLVLASRTRGDLWAARLDLPPSQPSPDAVARGRRRGWPFLVRHRARVASAAAVIGGISVWWFS